MSTNTSQSMNAVPAEQLQDHDPSIEDIATSIQQGKDGDEIIKHVKFLSVNQTDLKVEEWRTRCSYLNLFQLAILHRQKNLVEHLLIQYRSFMRKDLYWTFRHLPKSQESVAKQEQNKGQSSSSSLGVQTGFPVQQAANQQPAPAVISTAAASSEQQQVKSDAEAGIFMNHPLHLACWIGDVDIVRCLVKPAVSCVERKKFSHDQEHSLPVLSDKSREELQDLMRTVCTISVDAAGSTSQTHPQGLPLELAASSGSVACVKYLLSRVLLPWLSSHYYFMCVELKRKAVSLHLACCFSAPKVVALLLPALSKEIVHCRDGQGQTPLHFAVWNGDTDTIRLLLENGADANALTDSSYSCLQILYRSMLQPFNYEANTRLLLQYGADVKLCERASTGNSQGALSPLHVLLEEIMDATSVSLKSWEMNFGQRAEQSLFAYTQSKRPTRHLSTWSDYLQGLLSCMRLLLDAGANPNFSADVPNSSAATTRKTPLERILSREQNRLVVREPQTVLSVISLLLEFGASLTQENGVINAYLVPFLNYASVPEEDYINLFCEHGVGANALGHGLLAHSRQHPGWRLSWNISSMMTLANKMSIEGLRVLSQVLQPLALESKELDSVVSSLYGNPVRPLRHMCKVVLLRHLRNRSCNIKALLLPDLVKSYLKAHDYI